MGFFMDGKQINHESLSFSDVMRVAPVRISPVGDGRSYVIQGLAERVERLCELSSTERSGKRCSQVTSTSTFARRSSSPIEVYRGSQAPPQLRRLVRAAAPRSLRGRLRRCGRTTTQNKRKP